MTIILNHTIVAVGDKFRGTRFLADLLGVEAGAQTGPFAPVRVNDDLTLDFDDRLGARPGHYAFLVDDATFDRSLNLARTADLEYGLRPGYPTGRSTAPTAGAASTSVIPMGSPTSCSRLSRSPCSRPAHQSCATVSPPDASGATSASVCENVQ